MLHVRFFPLRESTLGNAVMASSWLRLYDHQLVSIDWCVSQLLFFVI